MERVVENHHGRAPGGRAGVLDRVLQRFAAGVEQRGALLVVARGQPVQRFGDLDVGLVGGGQEAGVGVARQLRGGAGDHRRGGVADGGDRDAAAEVDERVAVDVDEDAATGCGGVDSRAAGQTRGQRGPAPGGQLLGSRSGDLGDDAAGLPQFEPARHRICHEASVRRATRSVDGRNG